MNIQSVIFDLDGVIVDTAKYHYRAWQMLGEELNIKFTEKDNEQLKGVSRMRSLEILLEIGGQTRSETEKQMLAAKKNAWYLQHVMQMTADEILPGVLDFLQQLQAANVKIALGSASKNARTILDKVGLTDYFQVIVDGNAVSKAKPNPEVFLLAAKQLKAKSENTVVFEDAKAGIEAALAAKMLAVGVGSAETLGQAHAVIPGFAGLSWARLRTELKKHR